MCLWTVVQASGTASAKALGLGGTQHTRNQQGARGWMLKVREGLLWRVIMCSLKNLLRIGFLSERDRRLCDFMHHENHCAGGVENGV